MSYTGDNEDSVTHFCSEKPLVRCSEAEGVHGRNAGTVNCPGRQSPGPLGPCRRAFPAPARGQPLSLLPPRLHWPESTEEKKGKLRIRLLLNGRDELKMSWIRIIEEEDLMSFCWFGMEWRNFQSRSFLLP